MGSGACESEDEVTYPGDAQATVRASCEAGHVAPKVCDGSCINAGLNASDDDPCPHWERLAASSDWDPYIACRNDCPVTDMCEYGTRTFYSCECTVECMSDRSESFQAMLAHQSDCDDARMLPECQ